jgi:hypothetical protein
VSEVPPTHLPRFDEERLAELIAMLPPAPAGWTLAAQELPAAREELDEIVERARADAEFRRRLIDDLEAALATAGYEPRTALLAAVRASLPELD